MGRLTIDPHGTRSDLAPSTLFCFLYYASCTLCLWTAIAPLGGAWVERLRVGSGPSTVGPARPLVDLRILSLDSGGLFKVLFWAVWAAAAWGVGRGGLAVRCALPGRYSTSEHLVVDGLAAASLSSGERCLLL